MHKELEYLKAKFLADDIDAEDREENLQLIKDWEKGLIQNEAFINWQNHDITQEIIKKAKEVYKDMSLILALNRTLTEEKRFSLWAKQDACLFLLSLCDKDAKNELENIHKEIKAAISAV